MRFSGGELDEVEAPTDAAAETDRKAPENCREPKLSVLQLRSPTFKTQETRNVIIFPSPASRSIAAEATYFWYAPKVGKSAQKGGRHKVQSVTRVCRPPF